MLPGLPPAAPDRARVYALGPEGARRLDLTAPNLDALSLQLPEGVYTTLRTYAGGRILGLSAHLHRLAESQALLHQARPLDPGAVRAGLRVVLQQAALPAARVRLTVPFEGPAAFISVEPLAPYPAAYYTEGVRCATQHLARATPAAKHTAAIALARAARAANAAPAHEIVRVDEAGQLLEGLSSNFYAVLAGALRTARDGVLLGVTRSVVLAEAAGLLPVDERPVRLDDLPRLSEAFITSASREVMPVAQVDAVVVGAGRPGPVAVELLRRYRAYVQRAAEAP